MLLKLKHASNKPVYFREPFLLTEQYDKKSSRITFQPRFANLLSSKITQHDIKVYKAWKYLSKIL